MQELITPIWPTWKELSDDLGVPYTTVWSWKVRNRIPADYEQKIIAAAKARGVELTLQDFADVRKPHANVKQGAA